MFIYKHGLTLMVRNVLMVLLFCRTAPIHAEAPEFTDMSVEQEILVTGIKVVDLLAPYAKGGKIGKPLGVLLQMILHAFCILLRIMQDTFSTGFCFL